MIRNLDPGAERFLLDVGRIQEALSRANRQISSGLRVAAPSDDPDHVSEILQLYADLERNVQIGRNLDRARTATDEAAAALETAVRLVERARVLATQGAGTIQSAETRRILAGEVQALHEQMVNVSRTMVQNSYVFSGDDDATPGYRLNLANPNGVDRLSTASATRQLLHPSGTPFAAARTAGEIFDHRNPDDTLAADNVFAALNTLRLALENNDQAGIASSLTAVRAAGDCLNGHLSFYGTVQNRITEASEAAARQAASLKVQLSNLRDADLTEAILELERSRTHEQAAYSARSQMPRTSLFDYFR